MLARRREFIVLSGADYAGKSTVMRALAEDTGVHLVSVDSELLPANQTAIPVLRRTLVSDVLPNVGRTHSFEFAMSVLQTAVVHLRDRVLALPPDLPVLVDSYYYKILAKCRLLGPRDHPLYSWWWSFPQPRRVLYLDVSPETAWERSGRGARVNRMEHYGDTPDRAAFLAYQQDLAEELLGRLAHLPVTVVPEQRGADGALLAVREVLDDAA
ncbi:hypothetical protein IOD16_14765 [Saccharothrix sp. 6-C]|uniref:hypothetical protein n=1 Tax=Saccharothrix sp. 6-C TaxID=2781735 RepID=UPI0019170302|nr:hypothetical protein [Saccharothrix sp. 6-C]QQQ79544.1 hypothetical protein IOD16_14765 [Saccharothrix sp. 6-C]